MFSCFFVCLVIFVLVTDIVNFNSLGAGYFCTHINIHELCLGYSLVTKIRLILLGLAFMICYAGPK